MTTQDEECDVVFDDSAKSYVKELLDKADIVFAKTEHHKNCSLMFQDLECPIKVDDIKLLFIGARLLPNIMNYLVNILPQFLYPYIVAYLQDLSTEENIITVNDLFDLLNDLDKQ